ncbi:MAG: ThuA domain-containing protein [Planctomycetia bacterium]
MHDLRRFFFILGRRRWLKLAGAAGLLRWTGSAAAADPTDAVTEILIVVGPSHHGPGTHEVAANGRLVQHCLENCAAVPGVKCHLHFDWPADQELLKRAASVVFFGDFFPPARMPGKEKIMADLAAMMNRGAGIVCVHFATGLGAADMPAQGDHPLLHWMGGYFAHECKHHNSHAEVFNAEITPADGDHPVLRGWSTYTFDDEPYYNNYFGPNGPASNVVAVATTMAPTEPPTKHVVSWCIERKDGGRGAAVVMPHYYRNWKIDDLRTSILNAVVWTAKREVPKDGVKVDVPDLAAFKPASVEP